MKNMNDKQFILDGEPISPNDLIRKAEEAEEEFGRAALLRISMASRVLRDHGYSVETNTRYWNMKHSFRKGQRVRHIPPHAKGDKNHRDCEDGVVSSTNDEYVFVKYDNAVMKMESGDEPYTSKATKPDELIKI